MRAARMNASMAVAAVSAVKKTAQTERLTWRGVVKLTGQCLALLVLGVAPASANQIQWVAVQRAGTQRDCSASLMNVHWRVSETAKRITLQADSKSSDMGWRLNAPQLNSDGSGRIVTSYHNGRPAWFEFTAGHGPRTVYFNYGYHACVWELRPA
jgi:hypothetical protein